MFRIRPDKGMLDGVLMSRVGGFEVDRISPSIDVGTENERTVSVRKPVRHRLEGPHLVAQLEHLRRVASAKRRT